MGSLFLIKAGLIFVNHTPWMLELFLDQEKQFDRIDRAFMVLTLRLGLEALDKDVLSESECQGSGARSCTLME